jgi:putative membrane protein
MTRFVILALAAAFAMPALAQTSSPMQSSAQKASSMTQTFVKNAAITDMFEIDAGKLAQDKASNAAYKDFGKMIVEDHTKTADQMKAMQSRLQGAQIPTELDAKHKGLLSKLQSASGASFENQFRSAQIDGHKDAIRMFESYAAKGDNADLKKFAQETLPTLKTHLQHAQALPKGSAAPTVGSGSKMK